MVLARKSGIDPQVVFDAIKGGLAGSTVMNTKGPMMIEGNFDPGFRIVLHQKDLHNAILTCLLYTSPSPRDLSTSRMPSSA